MTTAFSILFRVLVSHDYYAGTCRDFDYVVPADTAAFLRNGKLIVRVSDGILFVLFQGDQRKRALVSLTGKKLRFGLKLNNPAFSNFTQFDIDPRSGTPLYANTTIPGTLDAPRTTVLVGRIFSHELSRVARPVTVNLKNEAGGVVRTDLLMAGQDRPTVDYDMKQNPSGSYSLEEVYGNGTVRTSYFYDPELLAAGVFGLVEVLVADSMYNAPSDLTITFHALLQPLRYYVVARNYTDVEFSKFTVVDSGAADDGRAQLTFRRVPVASFTSNEIPPDLLAGPDSRLVMFTTQTPLARREKPRTKIQLMANQDRLIDSLPQPSASKPKFDCIIQVTKKKG